MKKEITALESFSTVAEGDQLLAKNASGEMGFIPAGLVMGDGYACRRWDTRMSSPRGEAVGNIEYLKNLPSLIGLGCYLVDDAHHRRKLDPTDHYKFIDGSPAKLDGTMGQYHWGWNVGWYVAIWKEAQYFYLAASLKPIKGRKCYYIPPASKSAFNHGVMDRTTTTLCSVLSNDPRYRGGKGSPIERGSLTASDENLSMLGYAATSISTENFEKYGAKRGRGWGAGWYWIETATIILTELILGTRSIQERFNPAKDSNGLFQGGLGIGVTIIPSWDKLSRAYPVIPLSVGVELADAVGIANYPVTDMNGETVYNAPVPVFFGLKNPFGHLLLGKNRIVGKKIAENSISFFVAKSSLIPWNPSKTEEMIHVGDYTATSLTWSYITELMWNGLAGMPASSDGGTESTYFGDAAYLDSAVSGLRAPVGSGSGCSGTSAGLAYFFGNHAPSGTYANLSSPSCETEEDFDPVPRIYA